MKKHKFEVLFLTLLTFVGIAVVGASTASSVDLMGLGITIPQGSLWQEYPVEAQVPQIPPPACLDEPCENPPAGDVIPTFSGLIVNGISNFNGEVAIDPDQDGEPNFQAKDTGTIVIGNESTTNAITVFDTVNAIEIVTPGLFQVHTPGWITLSAPEVDFIDLNGGNPLIRIMDGGQLQAHKIGSFYKMSNSLDTAGSVVSTCKNDDFLTGCSGFNNAGLKYTYPNLNNHSCTVQGNAAGTTYAYAVCFDPAGVRSGTNPTN